MMMNLSLSLTLILSFVLILKFHPLNCSLNLILMSLNISFLMSYWKMTFWYSYILMLIFIGGIMILFIYMISLTPNKKFKKNNLIIYIMLLIMIMINIILMIDPTIICKLPISVNSINSEINKTTKIFNSWSIMITLTSMYWLFIMMIIVTKITSEKEGTIRKKF